MAVGALIGAYQEDDQGGLRALIPLSGRTLIEYQVRCASAAGTAPIVVIVERVPQALQDALERLRLDGIGVFPISDVQEALSRFEAGATIMLIGDGIAPTADLVARLAEEPEFTSEAHRTPTKRASFRSKSSAKRPVVNQQSSAESTTAPKSFPSMTLPETGTGVMPGLNSVAGKASA